MTGNVLYYPKSTSIYPGIYEPMQRKAEEWMSDMKEKEIKVFKPPVNIIELSDHYRIEMHAPGFGKDDFFINTHGCTLSIGAIKTQSHKRKEERDRFHGFHCCLKKNIELPTNVDTDFGTAEYRNGILYIYLYKSSYPVKNQHGQIIVY